MAPANGAANGTTTQPAGVEWALGTAMGRSVVSVAAQRTELIELAALPARTAPLP